jgi:3-methyl-2-oxobutanoate hydroxymethyltransferase
MPVTIENVKEFKAQGKRFVMLTAYEFQTAEIFDQAGIPIIFIGDTLGIFMLGYPNTIPVTMEAMIHHAGAVARAVRNALVVADLPFGADATVDLGVRNGGRLVQEGGAGAVKLEGPKFDLVRRLTESGIPVMGHLGLTPQSTHQLGGNKVQARTASAAAALVDNAQRLEEAGVFALVLEAIPSSVARQVTEALKIPTIGIGAGPDCDGQVLVSTEMLGISGAAAPRFAKRYVNLREQIRQAALAVMDEVATRAYPSPEQSYNWDVT